MVTIKEWKLTFLMPDEVAVDTPRFARFHSTDSTSALEPGPARDHLGVLESR